MSGKSRVPVLQLFYNTSGKADSLNARMSVITVLFLYACL